VTWHEHAIAYAAVKWPHAAAHTRAGIADALATITPALLTTVAGQPPIAVLRAALCSPAATTSRAARSQDCDRSWLAGPEVAELVATIA
jgi:hypothetical protein